MVLQFNFRCTPLTVLLVVVLASAANARCYLDGSDGFLLPLLYDAGNKPVCPAGFHCPGFDPNNASTYPRYCPPLPECQTKRTQGLLCDTSMGDHEPYICPQGKYCPNATTVLACPDGTYCPYGQQRPLSCPPMSVCVSGATGPTTFPSLVALGALFFLIYITLYFYRRHIVPCWLPSSYAFAKARSVTPNFNQLPTTDSHQETPERCPEEGSADAALALYFGRSRGDMKPLTISFRDLSVRLKESEERTLVAAVSGTLRPGTVTAILGPSGCGKTVLLKALLGRTDPSWSVNGVLAVNGDVHVAKYRSVIGAVPQDDILHTELTTFRNILYSGELRLPRTWQPEERADLMKAVLEALGIAHVVDVPIGNAESRGVSGGQRKRVSIGVELVAAPLALLLDEPTKGLDSNTALELVNTLRQIARDTNLTVAMVVNQPRTEIWNALDDVLILGPGGTTVFQGPRTDVAPHMTAAFGIQFPPEANTADVVLDNVSARGAEMAQLWLKRVHQAFDDVPVTPLTKEVQLEEVPWRGASFATQVYLAHIMYLEKQLNAMPTLYVELGVALFLGLMLGYSLSQFTPLGSFKYPFEMISPSPLVTLPPQMHLYAFMSLGLATSTAGVNAFVNDKETFARAAASGSSRVAFYIGTVTASWYRLFPVTLAFTAPYHVLARSSASFTGFYFIFYLFSFTMYAVAGIIALLADQRSSPLIAGVLAIVYSCFSGFIDFPNGIKKLSFCFWAAQALQQWMFADTEGVFGDMVSEWGWTINDTATSFWVIAVMGVIYHLVGLAILVQTRN